MQSLFCTGHPSIPQMRNCQTPNSTSVPWGNTGQSPTPWPRMHRGTRHFIGHPEEDVMMLRGCAVRGEDGEGSQAFKLKIYSNEMRSWKQCGRKLTKTPLAGCPSGPRAETLALLSEIRGLAFSL